MKFIVIVLAACIAAASAMNIPKTEDDKAIAAINNIISQILSHPVVQGLLNGKRDTLSNADAEKFFSFLTDFYQQIIVEPTNVLASSLASMGAHLAISIAEHGLAMFGKRSAEADEKILAMLETVGMGLLDTIVQAGALSLTQILAQIAMGNVSLLGGKRTVEEEKILAMLETVGMGLLDTIVQAGALSLTQILAQIAMGNVSLLGGKRTAEEERIFSFLTDFYQQIIVEPTNVLASSLASMGAHLAISIAEHGLAMFGKRSAESDEKILAMLETVGMGLLDTIVQAGALSLTQILAQIAMGNVSLLGGKRSAEVDEKIFNFISTTLANLGNSAYDLVNSAVQTGAFHTAVLLAGIAQNGLLSGKRQTPIDIFLHQQQ